MEIEQVEERRRRMRTEQVTKVAAWDGKTGVWVYCSFVDVERPEGQRFAGACIVKAPDAMSALVVAHRCGCNPGGEVKLWELPTDREKVFHPRYTHRLLSREDVMEMMEMDREVEKAAKQ